MVGNDQTNVGSSFYTVLSPGTDFTQTSRKTRVERGLLEQLEWLGDGQVNYNRPC